MAVLVPLNTRLGPAEWVEIVSAVDMHARPQQSSKTVKVVEKGLKLRVTARVVHLLYEIANDPPYWRNPLITVETRSK